VLEVLAAVTTPPETWTTAYIYIPTERIMEISLVSSYRRDLPYMNHIWLDFCDGMESWNGSHLLWTSAYFLFPHSHTSIWLPSVLKSHICWHLTLIDSAQWKHKRRLIPKPATSIQWVSRNESFSHRNYPKTENAGCMHPNICLSRTRADLQAAIDRIKTIACGPQLFELVGKGYHPLVQWELCVSNWFITIPNF